MILTLIAAAACAQAAADAPPAKCNTHPAPVVLEFDGQSVILTRERRGEMRVLVEAIRADPDAVITICSAPGEAGETRRRRETAAQFLAGMGAPFSRLKDGETCAPDVLEPGENVALQVTRSEPTATE